MSSSEDSTEYMLNPLSNQKEPSDYSFFYATLFICFFIALFLLVINVYFCCFSEFHYYWTDTFQGISHLENFPSSHKFSSIFFVIIGNYWILPFWVRSPANQVPVDLEQLEWVIKKQQPPYYPQEEFLELQRKESDL